MYINDLFKFKCNQIHTTSLLCVCTRQCPQITEEMPQYFSNQAMGIVHKQDFQYGILCWGLQIFQKNFTCT